MTSDKCSKPFLSVNSKYSRQFQTHSFKGAVTGQAVGMQRFRTVLPGWDQLVQNITGILIVTTAQLLHAGHLHPETCHLLLQNHIQLRTKRR